jgi:ATP-binding cassette, subfamily B, multidrug efflux pump
MNHESRGTTVKRPDNKGGHGPGGWMQRGIMPVQKAKNFKGTLFRLIGYFRPYRLRLLIVLLASVLSTAFSIVSPKLIGNAITTLFDGLMLKMKGVPGAHVDFSSIWQIILILAGLYILSSLFTYVVQYVMAVVAQKMVYQLREQVNDKLTRLPLHYYDSRPNGEILSRFVNDFDNISNTLQQSLTQLISSTVLLLGVIIMMLTISPVMTVVIFLTLPLSYLITKGIAKRSQGYFIGQQTHLGELNSHVEEMMTGHTIVKAFGYEQKSIQRFNEINESLYESGWKAQFISGIIMPMMNFVGNIGFVFVSVIGGILVTKRAIEIGDIQAFIQYARQFSQPITQLASIANIIQSTVASAERVFEILDEEEEIGNAVEAGPGAIKISEAVERNAAKPSSILSANGEVQFEHVNFGYKQDTPVIEDMNIRVSAGQTIAIVGPTGAGKTTLVNLLMRFYELDAGIIRIDGVDITGLKRKQLHSLFGMVLQDTWLFHGTIRENIAYGRIDATEAEIIAAAKAAHADHFIRTLPDGYDTILNEEGSNISQGQKQLLTIARAILADPTILILDEATSSVDTRTEIHIQKAMKEMMKGRTSFVIAHRLSTIREADLIIVMNHGLVLEQGNHASLMAKNGFYADLYNSQFTGRGLESEVG